MAQQDLPCVLIPAYKPDDKMISLISSLKANGFDRIVVVDDGSGAEFESLFDQAEKLSCTVLRHAINMGKGRALKTGFNEGLLQGLFDRGVITADADGQHAPKDILKIARAMADNPDTMVLGVRAFKGKVPLKSRLGNSITRYFFALIHGSDVRDTQTGLRGLPPVQIPVLLSLPGDRYEYEMNMLLALNDHDFQLSQVPIETIYIEGNRSSHFKVFQDSFRIYLLLFKFIGSSLFSTVVDYGLFAAMNILVPGQLIGSVAVARITSSFVNYKINRHIVFKRQEVHRTAALRYYGLVVFVMAASYGLIKVFNLYLGINLYLSKIMADTILYAVSFFVQREFVYRR